MSEMETQPNRTRTPAAVTSFFAFGLIAGLVWGVFNGLLNILDSAALPYGMSRLAIETLSRDMGDALKWGGIWAIALAVYGFAFIRLTGSGRRAVVTMGLSAFFWLAALGVVALRLLRDLDQKLPLPYQEHVTPGVFFTRFVWPMVSFAAATKPVVVLLALLGSFLIPAAAGFGVYLLLRRRLGDDPLARFPSLAMTKRRVIAVAVVLALAVGVVLVPAVLGKPSDAPNVLMISVDTLRADGLGCYGNPRRTTPVIDRLALNGLRFENFYSHAPWTLPGHVSMLTGMIPDVHGTYQLDRKIPREAPLLSEIFKNAGYHTFAMTSNFLVSPPYGFGRGFDRFLFRPEAEAAEVNDGALKLLAGATEPWFGFVHYFDPHLPYQPTMQSRQELGAIGPDVRAVLEEMTHLLYRFIDIYLPYNEAQKDIVRLLYDGEVRDVDRQIGQLMVALRKSDMLKNTVIVITADHGEEFFEHGWTGHSVALYEESLRVPLVIAGKGVKRGKVRTEVTSMDVLPPLVLRFAGIADPLNRSVKDIIDAGVAYGQSNAFGNVRYSYRKAGETFLTETDFTYGDHHITRPPQLFEDPRELIDLLGEKPEEAARLKDEMDHYVGKQIKTYGEMEGESLELDDARTQRLKELGYIN